MDAVQLHVETLAQRLQRSVAVDDADLRLLASSTHFDDVDAARVNSLARRRVEGPLREYALAQGIRSWHTPHSLEPNPEVGATIRRRCYPLRSRTDLLGFMWVMDATPLSSEDERLCEETAASVCELLATDAARETEEVLRLERLAYRLLRSDSRERALGMAEVQRLGIFAGARQFHVVALRHQPAGERLSEPVVSAVRRAISHVCPPHSPRMALAGVGETASVLVLGHAAPFGSAERRDLASRLLAELGRQEPALRRRLAIGIGAAQGALEDAHLSFTQAQLAARRAGRSGDHIVQWEADALADTLDVLIRPPDDDRLLPSAVQALNSVSPASLETLETYLDLGGNVMSTSAVLHTHRTTIYYRLSRFEETTGLDLTDGRVRLMLHLWLKTRRQADPPPQIRDA